MKYKKQPKRMIVGINLTGIAEVPRLTPECYHCGRLLVAKGKMAPNTCAGCGEKRKAMAT